STSGCCVSVSASPATQTSLPDVPSTSPKSVRDDPAGSGTGTCAQPFPSKWRTRLWLPFSPTAHTSFAANALTPWSGVCPPETGLETICQLEPFQCSINAPHWPVTPTAHALEAETIETARSWLKSVGPEPGT